MNILFLFVFVSVVCAGASPHSYLKCNKNYPKVETCLLKMIEGMREGLIAGRWDFPPIDPFYKDYIATKHDDTKITARDIVVTGGRDYKIDKLQLQLNNDVYHLKATLSLPALSVSAKYLFEHYIFFINVGGAGRFEGSFYGISVMVEAYAKPIKVQGKTYLELDSLNLRVTVADGDVYLSNDDLVSNKVKDKFSATNKRSTLHELTSNIEKKGNTVIENYIRKTFSTIPVEKFLYNGPRLRQTYKR